MCKIFGLPRSTYYGRIKRKPSKRFLKNEMFKDLIMNIYLKSKSSKDGWCYLASVLDLSTKKIVGYSFSKTMDTKITLEALNRAYNKQKPEKNHYSFR